MVKSKAASIYFLKLKITVNFITVKRKKSVHSIKHKYIFSFHSVMWTVEPTDELYL